jgi:transcriptional regulator NrdR family protein
VGFRLSVKRPHCPSCGEETSYERRVKLCDSDPQEIVAKRRWKCSCGVRIDTFEAIQSWRFSKVAGLRQPARRP